MDLDKQIAELEGKSAFVNIGSKAIFVKIGISTVISSIIIFLIKPLMVYKAEYDQKDKTIKYKMKFKNFMMGYILLGIIIFFIITKLNYFN